MPIKTEFEKLGSMSISAMLVLIKSLNWDANWTNSKCKPFVVSEKLWALSQQISYTSLTMVPDNSVGTFYMHFKHHNIKWNKYPYLCAT